MDRPQPYSVKGHQTEGRRHCEPSPIDVRRFLRNDINGTCQQRPNTEIRLPLDFSGMFEVLNLLSIQREKSLSALVFFHFGTPLRDRTRRLAFFHFLCRKAPEERTLPYSSFASMVIFAFRTFETGQPFSAPSAYFWNVAASAPGTLPTTFR
jgi:hypothetical protein